MKKLVLSLALVGAFGFASAQEAPREHDCHRPEQRKMERGKEGRGKRLEELNLSEKQTKQLEELRKQHKADKEKLHEKHQRKLKRILTPEQYEKWQSSHPKRKDERRMPPPPPMEQPEIKGN